MKRLEFVQSNPPIRDRDVALFEQELDFTLPADYRAFIIDNNGGLPSECVFDIPGLGQSSVVFLGINTGSDHSDLLTTWEAYKERLPREVMPIGLDPGGNLVCLAISGSDAGKVYFWSHEGSASAQSWQAMHWVSSTFESFIDSLQFEDNEAW